MSGLRLLCLSPALPLPATNGQKLRTLSLLRAIAANGHSVKLLSFNEGDQPGADDYRVLGDCFELDTVEHAVAKQAAGANLASRIVGLASTLPYTVSRFRSPALHARLAALVERERFDALLTASTYLLINIGPDFPVPLILDNQNIEYVLFERYASAERNPAKRAYARLEARRLRSWEQRANTRARLAMVCSGCDRDQLAALCPGVPIAVVPNTIDTEAYQPQLGEQAWTVLFSGGMDWYPNQQAVEFFAFRILPELRKLAPQVRFIIAGRSPAETFSRRFAGVPGLSFTGRVPDMRAEIARAAVCVVPLRIGSGTRLKILEAAAMGKPVVSTRLGAEGLEFVDGKEILLADEPAAFARTVADLLRDCGRRREMGAAARRRVEEQYSFPALCQAVGEAFAGI